MGNTFQKIKELKKMYSNLPFPYYGGCLGESLQWKVYHQAGLVQVLGPGGFLVCSIPGTVYDEEQKVRIAEFIVAAQKHMGNLLDIIEHQQKVIDKFTTGER